ncbi:hypothetical protein P3X46_020700 [Hevea brasiliensis]|uniref:DUF241 domain-containing protein n=1 Tax=Hevea brasiliensis TaxID=3981 RepID=A0ABQ9LD88_HEVBR|nr:uncharacterized protein LOC110654372 [Hevea brasiliensis]KAJ9165884.1 hypothetical protein P3X46_020700 [Hevea brasiliensis]
MAAACHLRSGSLPSKSHPLAASVEEQLTRLKAPSGSIFNKLGALKDLYERVDDLFQLPVTQQALSHEHQDKCLEEMLDGSLRLLDVCGTTRDVFSQMKECVQELESSLRRKRAAESSIENEVQAYTNSRKRLSKVISKCSGNLKRMEKKCIALSLNKDSDLVVVVSMLKEVEEISLMVFQSLLSFVSLSKARSRYAGWSIVSKLLLSRQIPCQAQAYASEVENMDVELLNLIGKTSTSLVEMQNVLKGLEALDSTIQQTEEELECIYRRLLKSRVSLLNMSNY